MLNPLGRMVRLVALTAAAMLLVSSSTALATIINAAAGHQSDATQTGVAAGGVPARAVDGNTNGNYAGGNSVTHTNTAANRSWEVDLQGTMEMSQVTLYNRTDCCSGRLSDITIDLLDNTGSVVDSSGVLNVGDVMAGPTTLTYTTASPLLARTVRVSRLGSTGPEPDILSLAEVQVMADNIALGASTTQDSNHVCCSPIGAEATDGNLGNFTHTDGADASDALTIDLAGYFGIDSVIMHNRDSCCGERLADITVELLDPNGGVVFTSAPLNPGNVLGSPTDIGLDLHDAGVNGGRFLGVAGVRLTRNGTPMSFGEVQVFGVLIPEPTTFVLSTLGLISLGMIGRRRSRR